MPWNAAQITVILFFIIACADDLKTQKFHNYFFVTFIIVGLALHSFVLPAGSFIAGTLGLLAAFAAMLPLVLLKAVGAGDLKLMLAIGLITDANTAFWTCIYALVWASIMGLIKVILSKKWNKLFVKIHDEREAQFKRIPHTVALFMAWIQLQLWGGF